MPSVAASATDGIRAAQACTSAGCGRRWPSRQLPGGGHPEFRQVTDRRQAAEDAGPCPASTQQHTAQVLDLRRPPRGRPCAVQGYMGPCPAPQSRACAYQPHPPLRTPRQHAPDHPPRRRQPLDARAAWVGRCPGRLGAHAASCDPPWCRRTPRQGPAACCRDKSMRVARGSPIRRTSAAPHDRLHDDRGIPA